MEVKPSIQQRFAVALIGLVASLALVATAHAGPKVESWQTSGGAKVMYVHAPDLPMVDVRVVLDAGSARDGELPGLARFTSAMLTEGAGDWDADALAERLESRGIELGASSLRDMAWVSMRSLTDPEVLDVALETAQVVLSAPRFDSDAIERVRQQMQIALRRSLQSPASVAKRRFFKTLYADHPYAHPPGGTERALAEIRKGDLQRFHQRYYVAANAVVAIVGAVERARRADRRTGDRGAQPRAPCAATAGAACGQRRRAA